MFVLVTNQPFVGASVDCMGGCPDTPELAIGASFVASFLFTAVVKLDACEPWNLTENLIAGGIGALAAIIHSLAKPLLDQFLFEPLEFDVFSKKVVEFLVVTTATTAITLLIAPLLGMSIEFDILASSILTTIITLRILANSDFDCNRAFPN